MKPKDKGSGELGRFVGLPVALLDCPAYHGLSVYAKVLLIDVARQYMGANNGTLLGSKRKMEEYGWKSSDTLHKALRELLEARLLFRTVQGQRPNKASWYALTWRTLDKSDGYDPGTESLFRRGAYLQPKPKPTRDELYAKWSPAKTQPLVRSTD
jgi:hypothetical protein